MFRHKINYINHAVFASEKPDLLQHEIKNRPDPEYDVNAALSRKKKTTAPFLATLLAISQIAALSSHAFVLLSAREKTA